MALRPFPKEHPPSKESFVTKGLLPANLPSVISSSGLATPYESDGNRYLVTQKRIGKTARFDATKRGEQRRSFSIPHPLFARDAGLFLENNWQSIWTHINNSTGSASKPMMPASNYRAVAITSQSKLREIRIRALAAKRYCLVTDIARCYPSVYTHSIPWALHSRQAAKDDRSPQSAEIWGNRLDFIHRQAQDAQTIGLPVGPDASRVTAEIILSRIDVDFLQATKSKTAYVRHVDDYWIGGDSTTECEQKLNVLRTGLSQFGLDINEAKTKIVELSEVTGAYWPDDLAKQIEEVFHTNRPWYAGGRVLQNDVNDMFSRAISIVRGQSDPAILKFLIRKMDSSKVWTNNWKKVEPFLAHVAVQFPHVFDYVARVLAWAIRTEIHVDRALWREVIGSVSRYSAEFSRDAELLWALWLYKELGFKVPRSVIDRAINNNVPLPLALAVHMATNDLVTNPTFFDDLQTRVLSSDMYAGSDWPIVLELFKVEKNTALRREYPLQGSMIQKPFATGASLVRYSAYPEVFYEDREEPEDREELDDHDFELPDHAIEDFTSSYDDEEDDEDWDGFEEDEDNAF